MRPGPAEGALWLEWERAGISSRAPLNRPLVIGSDAASDVCLPDASVAGRHAVVLLVNGQPFVDASGSSNGVGLDGGWVPQATLSPGQWFYVGETPFRVVGAQSSQPAASGPLIVGAVVAASNAPLAPRPLPPGWGGSSPGWGGPAGGMAGGATRSFLPLALLLLGAVAVITLVGGGLYFSTMQSRANSSAAAQISSGDGALQEESSQGAPVRETSQGAITFNPSSTSCTSPATVIMTVDLPASMQSGDSWIVIVDGVTWLSGTLSSTTSGGATAFVRRSDGSWRSTNTLPPTLIAQSCYAAKIAARSSGMGMTPSQLVSIMMWAVGHHTMQATDSSGNVVAEGHYTITE